MNKIGEMLGRRLNEIPVGPDYTRPHPHTSVGIEVEVEGLRDYRRPWKRWHLDENEGSLVNGVEFVSEPVWGTAITDTLEELAMFFVDHPPHISFRTSVHVHVNILDMTRDQLANMIKLNLIYEPALFRLHDKWDRGNNVFCVPATKSVVIQRAYSRLLQDIRRGVAQTDYVPSKYSAMNINCIKTLGTLEFRHMGGTADMDEISDWINIILQMKVAALLDEPYFNPEEVWGEYRDRLDIRPLDLSQGKTLIQYLEMGV